MCSVEVGDAPEEDKEEDDDDDNDNADDDDDDDDNAGRDDNDGAVMMSFGSDGKLVNASALMLKGLMFMILFCYKGVMIYEYYDNGTKINIIFYVLPHLNQLKTPMTDNNGRAPSTIVSFEVTTYLQTCNSRTPGLNWLIGQKLMRDDGFSIKAGGKSAK